MFKGVVHISPNYQVRHYTDLQLDVNSSAEFWEEAVKICKDRMEGRFLLIIQDMLGKIRDKDIDYSFSIMALNCLFIETLRQFELGLDTTENYRGANEKAFVDFFRRSEYFKEDFPKKIAEIFYNHIRCGILHQAQTKDNSQLSIDQPEMVIVIENMCIRVDVEKFTNFLIEEYEYYLHRLRTGNSVELKKRFIKKMNHIVNMIVE